MDIRLEIDTSSLRRLSGRLDVTAKQINRAMRRALKGTTKSVRVSAKKIVKKRYTYVDTSTLLTTERFSQIATIEEASAILKFYGRRGAGLRHFRPNPKRVPQWKGIPSNQRKPLQGVSSQILKEGERKVYAGPKGEKPFWARAKQGFMALFYRPEGTHEGKDLKMKYGPSAVQALGKSAETMLREAAVEALNKNMEREAGAVLRGYL